MRQIFVALVFLGGAQACSNGMAPNDPRLDSAQGDATHLDTAPADNALLDAPPADAPAIIDAPLATDTPGTMPDASLCYDPAPIQESFHTMLGRDGTVVELNHFAQLVARGYQIAWYEPYPSGPSDNFCYSHVARASSNDDVGIPYYNAATFGNVNAEFAGRGGGAAVQVTAIYRTLFGRMPDPPDLAMWVGVLGVRPQTCQVKTNQARDGYKLG